MSAVSERMGLRPGEWSVRTRKDEGRRPRTTRSSVGKCDFYPPQPSLTLPWHSHSFPRLLFADDAETYFFSPVFSQTPDSPHCPEDTSAGCLPGVSSLPRHTPQRFHLLQSLAQDTELPFPQLPGTWVPAFCLLPPHSEGVSKFQLLALRPPAHLVLTGHPLPDQASLPKGVLLALLQPALPNLLARSLVDCGLFPLPVMFL